MRVEVAHERPAEPQLPPMQASHFDPLHRRGRTGSRRRSTPASRRRILAARAGRAANRRGARPERSGDLGPGGPQRALPLRLGQEIQALPRRGGLRPLRTRLADGAGRDERAMSEAAAPGSERRNRRGAGPGRGGSALFLSHSRRDDPRGRRFRRGFAGLAQTFGVVWALRRGVAGQTQTGDRAARPAAAGGEIPRSSSTGSPPGPWRRAAWCCAWRRARRKTRATNPCASACALSGASPKRADAGARAGAGGAGRRSRHGQERTGPPGRGFDQRDRRSGRRRRAGGDRFAAGNGRRTPDPDFCAPRLSPDQAKPRGPCAKRSPRGRSSRSCWKASPAPARPKSISRRSPRRCATAARP